MYLLIKKVKIRNITSIKKCELPNTTVSYNVVSSEHEFRFTKEGAYIYAVLRRIITCQKRSQHYSHVADIGGLGITCNRVISGSLCKFNVD